MQAYASLHTAKPDAQIDHEVSYAGYYRLPMEFDESIFGNGVLRLNFPVIEADTAETATYVAIGSAERGQGEIFLRVPVPGIALLAQLERRTEKFWREQGAPEDKIEACIKNYGPVVPRIAVYNEDAAELPEHLNPIARVAHRLVYSGLMETSALHPKLFEAINDALHNAGIPVLKVVRGGAAKIEITSVGRLPSLSEWGDA